MPASCGGLRTLRFCRWVAKRISRSSLSRGTDQRFHMIEIFFQRPAASRRQPKFGLEQPAREGLGAADVPGVFQLARVDAQVAVGDSQELLQFVEPERLVHRQRADDSQAGTLVN